MFVNLTVQSIISKTSRCPNTEIFKRRGITVNLRLCPGKFKVEKLYSTGTLLVLPMMLKHVFV